MPNKDKAEKATYPTSAYLVTCDTFEKELKIQLHQTEDTKETKLLVSIGDEKVSLYGEDAEMLHDALDNLRRFAVSRKTE